MSVPWKEKSLSWSGKSTKKHMNCYTTYVQSGHTSGSDDDEISAQ